MPFAIIFAVVQLVFLGGLWSITRRMDKFSENDFIQRTCLIEGVTLLAFSLVTLAVNTILVIQALRLIDGVYHG